VNTIKKLLASRKFLTCLAGLVVVVGVLLSGWDEAHAAEIAEKIVNTIMLFVGLFVGGTALEDAAAKLKNGGNLPKPPE